MFDTTTWTPRQIFDMSESGLPNGGFFSGSNGDSIVVTSDDQTIIVTNVASGWVHVLSLAEPLGSDPGVTGTLGDDALVAIIGQDVDGLGGTDSLEIDFRTAQAGVTADFRDLATQSSITVEGATIANIENIQRIDGSQFSDFLAIWQNFPIGNAQVYGYGGDDEIIVGVEVGSFGPYIDGGDGNDLIDARGTFQNGSYFGGVGNDTIYTSNSNNAVGVGGEGNDYIESWGSADGGEGDDTIVMHNPGNVSGATPRASGGIGNDVISAVNIGSPATLPTYFLGGGSGADRITGSAGQDYITSTEFDSASTSTEDTGTERDTLIGGAGGDRLFAGFGDNVDGGAGFDILVYSFGGSPTAITFNTDSLVGAGPFSIGGGTIQSIEAIDRLYGTNFDDVITVGANSNPPSARTQVFGGLGNDTFMNTADAAFFIGGDGNDTYVVLAGSQTSDFSADDGSDTVDYSQLTSGLAVTLSSSVYGEFGSAAGGSLFSVENVQGTNHADTIIGSSANNRLIGRNGNDIIDGGYGDDFLDGGSGTDEVRFLHGFNGVNVNLSLTGAQNTGLGFDTIRNFENLGGSNFNDTLTGSSGSNVISGYDGDDVIDGAAGNDTLIGGAGFDTAVYGGNFSAFTVREGLVGAFTVDGAGIDTLDGIERLRFSDVEILLDLGSGLSIDPGSDNPDTFMINIRDFDGNDLRGALGWEMIGQADANLDGSADYIFVNREIGRFAEVSVGANGLVQFDNHGQGGDTRVVGIYIDPLVESGEVEQGSDFDSQRRFQNDLFIGNIATVLGSEDYDGDGFAEIFFALTDGTAYLRAIMHADGNIQYANYQSEQQVIDYLTANGYDDSTFGNWFSPIATGTSDTVIFVNEQDKAPTAEQVRPFEAIYSHPLEEWQSEFVG